MTAPTTTTTTTTDSAAVSTSATTTSPPTSVIAEYDDNLGDETDQGRYTDDEDAHPPAKKRRRTPRPPVILSEEDTAEMAEFLKKNDNLYNKSRCSWKDTKARARLWDQQGHVMNRTGEELQQWYESLRTKLGRLKKKAQNNVFGAEVLTDSKKRLLHLFDFLTPHMYIVQRKNGVSVSISK